MNYSTEPRSWPTIGGLVPRLGWGVTWRSLVLLASLFAWRVPAPIKALVVSALVVGVIRPVWRRRDGLGTGWRLLLAVAIGYLAFDLPTPRLMLLGLTVAVTVVALDLWWTCVGGLEPYAKSDVDRDSSYFCQQCSLGFAAYEAWHDHRWRRHVTTPGAGSVLRVTTDSAQEPGVDLEAESLKASEGHGGAVGRGPAKKRRPGGAEILLAGSTAVILGAAVAAAVR